MELHYTFYMDGQYHKYTYIANMYICMTMLINELYSRKQFEQANNVYDLFMYMPIDSKLVKDTLNDEYNFFLAVFEKSARDEFARSLATC